MANNRTIVQAAEIQRYAGSPIAADHAIVESALIPGAAGGRAIAHNERIIDGT